jgi:hypothetical protein
MEALKFFHPGRVAPFSGVTWPPPGQWLASAARPELCRVEGWNDRAAREFAGACAAHVGARATGRATEYAADAAAAAGEAVAGDSATRVGYMAAHAAEAMAPGGFAVERRWQSRWLADRLGVSTA